MNAGTSPIKQPASFASIVVARLFASLLFAFFASSSAAVAQSNDDASGATSKQRDNIVVIGDSLSAAYGIAVEDGWVALLQLRLDQQYPAQFHVINSSISGDTSANGLKRLPRLLNEYQPIVVIVELGGNDGLRGLSLKKLRENLSDMVALSAAEGANSLLVGVQIPSNYGAAYTRGFTQSFETVADEHGAGLVPSLMAGFEPQLDHFLDDRIHPNERAQPLMLDNVWPGLEPLLLLP